MQLQPHQQRVVDEAKELDEKVRKLASFMRAPTSAFHALPEVERMRLFHQHRAMVNYLTILYERTAAFPAEITFDELVQHGRDSGANIVNGMPWSFSYLARAVTHENDTRYIVDTGRDGVSLNMCPGDILVADEGGAFTIRKAQ